MSTKSAELKTSGPQSLDRERVFDAFRRWGYMDAALNPFGGPIAGGYPDLRMKGAIAEEAREIYCGSIGVEFMHLPQQDRRERVQERRQWTGAGWPSACCKLTSSSRSSRPATWAPSVIPVKAQPRRFRCWT